MEETPRKNNTRRGNRQNDPRKIGIWSESFQCEKGLLRSTNLGHKILSLFPTSIEYFFPLEFGHDCAEKEKVFLWFQLVAISMHNCVKPLQIFLLLLWNYVDRWHCQFLSFTIVYYSYRIPAASVVLAVQVSFLTRTLLAQRNTSQNPR